MLNWFDIQIHFASLKSVHKVVVLEYVVDTKLKACI